MNHISGKPRLQIQIKTFEESYNQDNPVRIIDASVEQLDLAKLGFAMRTVKQEDWE